MEISNHHLSSHVLLEKPVRPHHTTILVRRDRQLGQPSDAEDKRIARYARDCPARLLRIGPDYRVHEEPCTIDYFRSTCKRSAFHVNRVHDCRYCIKESVLALFSAAVAKCDVQRDTVSAISRCAFILVFAIRKRAKSAHRQ